MTAPFVIGLTGGIGSGKTAVSDRFAEKGISIIDADVIAREVVQPGTTGLDSIIARFGKAILLPDGQLDRAALRKRVFASEEDKEWLNQLLHPLIRKAMQSAIEEAPGPYCILSVPLLVENGLDKMVNRVLVVDCTEEQQFARASARDGSDAQTIRSIMASQASRQERLARSDDIIDNSQSLDWLSKQVDTLHDKYLALISSVNAE